MKRIFFVFPIFLFWSFTLIGEPVLKKIELKSGFTTNIPIDEISNASYSINTTSALVSIKGLESKVLWNTNKTLYGTEPAIKTPAWGVLINTNDFIKAPFYFYVGQINTGGSISKLKTPYINQTANPLSKSKPKLKTLTLKLPSASSFNNPIATAQKFEYKNKNTFIRQLSLSNFNDFEEKDMASITFSIGFSKNTELGFSFTTSRFLQKNINTYWFSKNVFFVEDWYWAQNAQISFNSSFFNSSFSVNSYQNHLATKESFDHTYCSENSISIKNFCLFFSAFYADSNFLFTTSGTHLKVLQQAKINPQFYFYTKNNLFKINTGLCTYFDKKLTGSYDDAGNPLTSNNIKIAYAVDITTKDKKNKLSVQIQDINKSLTCSAKIANKIILTKSKDFYAKNTITAKTTEFDSYSIKEELKVYYKKKTKKLNVSLTATVKLPLDF